MNKSVCLGPLIPGDLFSQQCWVALGLSPAPHAGGAADFCFILASSPPCSVRRGAGALPSLCSCLLEDKGSARGGNLCAGHQVEVTERRKSTTSQACYFFGVGGG